MSRIFKFGNSECPADKNRSYASSVLQLIIIPGISRASKHFRYLPTYKKVKMERVESMPSHCLIVWSKNVTALSVCQTSVCQQLVISLRWMLVTLLVNFWKVWIWKTHHRVIQNGLLQSSNSWDYTVFLILIHLAVWIIKLCNSFKDT